MVEPLPCKDPSVLTGMELRDFLPLPQPQEPKYYALREPCPGPELRFT